MSERYRFFCGIGAALLPFAFFEIPREIPPPVFAALPYMAKIACGLLCGAITIAWAVCFIVGLSKRPDDAGSKG